MNPEAHISLLLVSADEAVTACVRQTLDTIPREHYQLFVAKEPAEALNKTLPSIQCCAVLIDFEDATSERLIRFCKVLRQHYSTLPIIALVASDSTEEVTKLLRLGIHDHIRREGLTSEQLFRILAFAQARTASLSNDITEHQFLNLLLENYPDYIYFKDRDGVFLRTSESLARAVGAKDRDDMIGRTDFDYFDDEHARKAFQDELQVMRTRKAMIGEYEPAEFPVAGRQWVSTTRVAITNSADLVIGTMGISRVVSSQPRA